MAGGRQQFLESLRAYQGHIAVKHQHRGLIRDLGHGLGQGMARAFLFRLMRPSHVPVLGEGRAHLLAAVAVDHVDRGRFQGAPGVEHMPQQRFAGHGVQHLGHVGIHALALAGGQDDDFEGVGHRKASEK